MSKMVKCKTCGQMIAKSAKVCPHCGAKANRHPILLAFSTVFFIFAILFFVGIIIAATSESSSKSSSETVDNSGTTNDVIDNTTNDTVNNATDEQQSKVIYDENGLTISFTGFSDAPSPAIGYYINLHIENTSDTDYMIQANDISVDDIMVPFGNSIFSPDVLAGKTANTYIWVTNTEQLGITKTPSKAELTFRFFPNRDLSVWQDSEVITIE